jgi:chaperone required for assembly of F1-ATPase
MAQTKVADLLKDLHVAHKQDHYILYANAKPMLTPAERPYRLPTAALAEAMADEWRAEGEKIVPATMPLTQLAATALDIVANDRPRIEREILGYATSELLCHRIDQPETLVARQEEVWQPLLAWCERRFGAPLQAGVGIMPISQTPEAVTALQEAIKTYDDFALTGLSHATDVTGSLVCSLALAERERDAVALFEAAELDTSFQALKWGVDPVTEARFDSIRRDLENCERWFELLKE